MNSWSKMPFVRIIIPFVAGILMYRSGLVLLTRPQIISILITLFLSTGVWLFAFPRLNPFKMRYIQGILLIAGILLSGYYISFRNDLRNSPHFVGRFLTEKESEMILQIDNSVEQKNNTFKTTAKAIAIKTNNGWESCDGKILLYIARPDSGLQPDYGDRIVAKLKITGIESPVFNSDFNYRKFLADKNIFHQAYIANGNWTLLGHNTGNPLMKLALGARMQLVSILQNQLGKTDEYAVVSAMLAGYRADMSADMMQSYSNTGAIHIMAVSGLHVGVIYLMMLALLGLIPFIKKQKWLGVVLVLGTIWFYALLTGLSASVLRATLMISFVAIGKTMRQNTSPFNNLAAAAFILLAINPNTIGEIGFQLSFAAVAGILLFFSPIYRIFYFRRKLPDKIWQLICVSLAAQLATIPFVLYYFGQFPVYFLLTNILVVPLSGVVLYAGMGAVLFSWIPGISHIAAWATIFLAKAMNFIVGSIESLPYAVLGNIYVNAKTALFIAFIIVFGFLMFRLRKIRFAYPILIFILLATAFQWEGAKNERETSFWFALKDGKQYVTGIKNAGKLYVIEPDFAPSAFILNRIGRFANRNHLQLIPVTQQYNDSLVFRHNQFMAWSGYTIMNISGYKLPPIPESFPQADVLFAPALSKYHQRKYLAKKPSALLMTKYSVQTNRTIELNQHRDWAVNLNTE
ncbi:MAG: hypothetical protein CVU11_11270 [Bacteroidetes bacterium HGW-Bacteroidetes-6]|jgi:competence protein ComEC|nr:MAG: hypothetical protein CVU11_11270 [Bacteroidetes bacterium HGW-Bacteroidetes-6]